MPSPINVVDLTLDDDEDDSHDDEQQRMQRGSFNTPDVRHLFGSNHFPPPRDASRHAPPPPHERRPAKRRRTDVDPNLELKRCLDQQVFPHIERALARLYAYNYSDYERKKLDEAIFDKIVKQDKDFEHNFKSNHGRLSLYFEDHVRVSAERLVQEDLEVCLCRSRALGPCTDRIPQRKAVALQIATKAAFGVAAVLPSIEQEAQPAANDNDRPFGASAEAGAHEYYDSYDDHDEDNHEGLEASPGIHYELPKPKEEPITPQRIRARLKAKQWQSGKAVDPLKKSGPEKQNNTWFGLRKRPYLPLADRDGLLGYHGKLTRLPIPGLPEEPRVVHVDFTQTEIEYLQKVARSLFGSLTAASRDTLEDLRHLLKKAKKWKQLNQIFDAHEASYMSFAPETPPGILMTRSTEDLKTFVTDLYFRRVNTSSSQVMSIRRDDTHALDEVRRTSVVPSLLYAREIAGRRPFGSGSMRRYENLRAAFMANREDSFEPRVEWTNCAGDIMTVSWISSRDRFICGTTTHSDSHNQQYNKPGNLLLGSSKGTLRAFADHRIPRPVVSTGDNSLESMVESQDPWLYTSVVSSDYDRHNDLAFTSSFDKTVKVWKVYDDHMEAVDTWEHGGRVNFVLASKHKKTATFPEAGDRAITMVATAADVATDAVRVYKLCVDPSQGHVYHNYDSYSCTKVHDEDYVPSDKWAYFPAAIRWGLAPGVQHLLLIGYSPRSLTDHEEDIPEDKQNSGELCLWDTLNRRQISVNSAATQNVFEVAWHPFQACFAAATSKGTGIDRIQGDIKTQIRIFQPNTEGQYTCMKILDCRAMDINELVIRQNSIAYSYVAAGCTDGNVYIWDTAGTDRPMCVLTHGEPVEELFGDREREDVGVKFVEWASSTDRLYTGSSDGAVKVWDIRHGRAILIRDLIECAGPTQLAVGDGSGRVYLLSLDEGEREEVKPIATATSGLWSVQLAGQQTNFRRPRPFIPHAEVPPPPSATPAHTEAKMQRNEYLEQQVLRLHPDPTIGVVQGPNYAACGFYRAEAHVDGDPRRPLLDDVERQQQENGSNMILAQQLGGDSQQIIARLREVTQDYSSLAATREAHWRNGLLDLDVENLEAENKSELDITEPDFDLVYEDEDDEDAEDTV
ncbi:WD repeat-containing protein [Apiospora aurea]|uniref:WD repeat-containing protein n=1 Tax=Apiospora aurea TaxID=335848 RepID=A0ABR1Q753_9PEZI